MMMASVTKQVTIELAREHYASELREVEEQSRAEELSRAMQTRALEQTIIRANRTKQKIEEECARLKSVLEHNRQMNLITEREMTRQGEHMRVLLTKNASLERENNTATWSARRSKEKVKHLTGEVEILKKALKSFRKLEKANQTLTEANQTLTENVQTLTEENQTLATENEALSTDNQLLEVGVFTYIRDKFSLHPEYTRSKRPTNQDARDINRLLSELWNRGLLERRGPANVTYFRDLDCARIGKAFIDANPISRAAARNQPRLAKFLAKK